MPAFDSEGEDKNSLLGILWRLDLEEGNKLHT
jgi:hypothetical protein